MSNDAIIGYKCDNCGCVPQNGPGQQRLKGVSGWECIHCGFVTVIVEIKRGMKCIFISPSIQHWDI